MSVNGLGEVSMDTTQTVISSNLIANNLIALGKKISIKLKFGKKLWIFFFSIKLRIMTFA